ncbi:hypothetical protein EJ04DRAFT_510728 [Polyplosphaeria fusca]|uniref:Uncharacterized protein n=1 Tax=Polyplosphaeria fusca TaxID=682080 RepID=A0A9P4R5G9_9PLEO|nr:hypothetical protein EJ04DRAFT_510728 [Polyplosphaeria fusca]
MSSPSTGRPGRQPKESSRKRPGGAISRGPSPTNNKRSRNLHDPSQKYASPVSPDAASPVSTSEDSGQTGNAASAPGHSAPTAQMLPTQQGHLIALQEMRNKKIKAACHANTQLQKIDNSRLKELQAKLDATITANTKLRAQVGDDCRLKELESKLEAIVKHNTELNAQIEDLKTSQKDAEENSIELAARCSILDRQLEKTSNNEKDTYDNVTYLKDDFKPFKEDFKRLLDRVHKLEHDANELLRRQKRLETTHTDSRANGVDAVKVKVKNLINEAIEPHKKDLLSHDERLTTLDTESKSTQTRLTDMERRINDESERLTAVVDQSSAVESKSTQTRLTDMERRIKEESERLTAVVSQFSAVESKTEPAALLALANQRIEDAIVQQAPVILAILKPLLDERVEASTNQSIADISQTLLDPILGTLQDEFVLKDGFESHITTFNSKLESHARTLKTLEDKVSQQPSDLVQMKQDLCRIQDSVQALEKKKTDQRATNIDTSASHSNASHSNASHSNASQDQVTNKIAQTVAALEVRVSNNEDLQNVFMAGFQNLEHRYNNLQTSELYQAIVHEIQRMYPDAPGFLHQLGQVQGQVMALTQGMEVLRGLCATLEEKHKQQLATVEQVENLMVTLRTNEQQRDEQRKTENVTQLWETKRLQDLVEDNKTTTENKTSRIVSQLATRLDNIEEMAKAAGEFAKSVPFVENQQGKIQVDLRNLYHQLKRDVSQFRGVDNLSFLEQPKSPGNH